MKRFQAADDAELEGALIRAVRSGGHLVRSAYPVGAHKGVARADRGFTQGGLRGLLLQLKVDAPLAEFLESSGRFGEFNEAMDRILGRLTGSLLQNARGLEQSYRFVELSQLSGGFVDSAQIHFSPMAARLEARRSPASRWRCSMCRCRTSPTCG